LRRQNGRIKEYRDHFLNIPLFAGTKHVKMPIKNTDLFYPNIAIKFGWLFP